MRHALHSQPCPTNPRLPRKCGRCRTRINPQSEHALHGVPMCRRCVYTTCVALFHQEAAA